MYHLLYYYCCIFTLQIRSIRDGMTKNKFIYLVRTQYTWYIEKQTLKYYMPQAFWLFIIPLLEHYLCSTSNQWWAHVPRDCSGKVHQAWGYKVWGIKYGLTVSNWMHASIAMVHAPVAKVTIFKNLNNLNNLWAKCQHLKICFLQ